eukprot:6096223-Pyramimonas_sp.AAC.1
MKGGFHSPPSVYNTCRDIINYLVPGPLPEGGTRCVRRSLSKQSNPIGYGKGFSEHNSRLVKDQDRFTGISGITCLHTARAPSRVRA